jgi:hypothetical protein
MVSSVFNIPLSEKRGDVDKGVPVLSAPLRLMFDLKIKM